MKTLNLLIIMLISTVINNVHAQISKIDWKEFDKDPITAIQKNQSTNQLKYYSEIASVEEKGMDSLMIYFYSDMVVGGPDSYMFYKMNWDSTSKTLTRFLVDSMMIPGMEYCNRNKYETTFDENNTITKHIEYSFNKTTSQWEESRETVFSYTNGLLTQTIESIPTANGIVLDSKSDIEYNNAGLQTVIADYTYDVLNAKWLTSSKREFGYDANKNMISYKMFTNNTDKTDFVITYNDKDELTYDSNNNLILDIRSHWMNYLNDWEPQIKTEYVYSNNLKIKEDVYNYTNSIYVLDYSVSYTYNALGKISEKIQTGRNEERVIYGYNENGESIYEASYFWNVTDWKLNMTYTTEYNKNGEIESQVLESGTFTGELTKSTEVINYFPLHVESMNVMNGNIIELEFDSKIVPSDTIASLIVIGNPLLKEDNSLYVVSANIDPTNEYKLIIVLNREILPGEETSISIKKGLQTKNGRNVTFSIKAGNISNGIENIENSTITASYNNSNKTILVQSQNDLKSIKIIGIDGKTYYSQMNQNSSEAEINATNFTTGVYIIQASDAIGNSTNQKIVIK
jgi:hypothetical protein